MNENECHASLQAQENKIRMIHQSVFQTSDCMCFAASVCIVIHVSVEGPEQESVESRLRGSASCLHNNQEKGERKEDGMGGAYPAARHSIWVIILEQRQYNGTYTQRIPLYAFPPLFLLVFLPFWASSPHQWCSSCPSPIWNGPCINFPSSLPWAVLGRQGLGSTGVVASQDPTPRSEVSGGGGGSMGPKIVLWNNGPCALRR